LLEEWEPYPPDDATTRELTEGVSEMDHCYPGIYVIVCKVNDKRYVGSARNIYQRWASHRSMLRHHKTHSHILQAAWDKYGEENFEFMALERVDDLDNLIAREQHYINLLKPEYNIRKIADRNDGVKMPREAVEMVAKINSERVRPQEERELHRQNRLGMKFSPEWCENISKGKQNTSPETRALMSAAKKGKAPTVAIEASRKANTGRTRPPEVMARIVETKRKKQELMKSQGIEYPKKMPRDDKGRFTSN
jgi:group I intron endonuclease